MKTWLSNCVPDNGIQLSSLLEFCLDRIEALSSKTRRSGLSVGMLRLSQVTLSQDQQECLEYHHAEQRAPQGCELNILLFMLMTHDCAAMHS